MALWLCSRGGPAHESHLDGERDRIVGALGISPGDAHLSEADWIDRRDSGQCEGLPEDQQWAEERFMTVDTGLTQAETVRILADHFRARGAVLKQFKPKYRKDRMLYVRDTEQDIALAIRIAPDGSIDGAEMTSNPCGGVSYTTMHGVGAAVEEEPGTT